MNWKLPGRSPGTEVLRLVGCCVGGPTLHQSSSVI